MLLSPIHPQLQRLQLRRTEGLVDEEIAILVDVDENAVFLAFFVIAKTDKVLVNTNITAIPISLIILFPLNRIVLELFPRNKFMLIVEIVVMWVWKFIVKVPLKRFIKCH